MFASVPIQVSIWEGFWEVVVVGFGYFLKDSVFGEFGVLEEVRGELSFGFHGEIEGYRDQGFEGISSFEKHRALSSVN